MEFSICIVSYNCREQLRACLDSIRANRPTVDHEVIVVDNGSSDGTVEMLQGEFYWTRSIANPSNRGFSVACNQAILAATGKVGAWGYIGIVPLLTGAVGFCPLYTVLGLNTCPVSRG